MTFESNPSFGQFALWKLGKIMAKRERAREATHAPTWFQTTIRLMMQLCGFGCLTFAGFTVSITAGLIVAGIACFVLSWLSTGRPQETEKRQ